METMPLHLFISAHWSKEWRKVLILKIKKYFKDKNFEIKIVSTPKQADIILYNSEEEESSTKDLVPLGIPCIYMIKTLLQKPTRLAHASFGKIPHSINLIGLGIMFERMRPKE